VTWDKKKETLLNRVSTQTSALTREIRGKEVYLASSGFCSG